MAVNDYRGKPPRPDHPFATPTIWFGVKRPAPKPQEMDELTQQLEAEMLESVPHQFGLTDELNSPAATGTVPAPPPSEAATSPSDPPAT